jgi:hypothetical protein
MEHNKFNLNKLNFAAYWIPLLFTNCCVKGTAILIQIWTGLEGSRRLRLPDLETIGT